MHSGTKAAVGCGSTRTPARAEVGSLSEAAKSGSAEFGNLIAMWCTKRLDSGWRAGNLSGTRPMGATQSLSRNRAKLGHRRFSKQTQQTQHKRSAESATSQHPAKTESIKKKENCHHKAAIVCGSARHLPGASW